MNSFKDIAYQVLKGGGQPLLFYIKSQRFANIKNHKILQGTRHKIAVLVVNKYEIKNEYANNSKIF